MTIINPPNKMVIEQVTMFVSVDDNGHEGVIGQQIAGAWFPFVCADERIVKQLLPLARKMKEQGVNIRIVKFTNKEYVTEKYEL